MLTRATATIRNIRVEDKNKRKLSVQFVNEAEASSTTADPVPNRSVAKTFEFNTVEKKSFEDHMKTILRIHNIDPSTHDRYCLQVEATKGYLFPNENQDESSVLSKMHELPLDTLVFLRLKPNVRATNVLTRLKEAAIDSGEMKLLVFGLKSMLKDPEFADYFISQGGIVNMLRVISESSGNILSYSLSALREGMSYVLGMEEVCSNSRIVLQLFRLVSNAEVVGICRTALELLFIIASFAEHAFHLINSAAVTTAKELNIPTWKNVILRLGDGDQDIKNNALTLLNVTFSVCEDQNQQRELVKTWEQAGIVDALKKQVNAEAAEFRIQLDVFEQQTGLRIRPKQDQYESQIQLLKDKLNVYESQQALVHILKNELLLTTRVIRDASKNGALISGNVPLQRYVGENTELPLPEDLSFMKCVTDERQKVIALESKLKKKKQRAAERKEQIQKLQSDNQAALAEHHLKSATLQNEITQLKAAIEKHQQKEQQNEEQIRSLNEQLQNLESQKHEATNQISWLKQEQSKLEEDKQRLDLQVQQLEQNFKKADEDHHSHVQTLSQALNLEISKLSSEKAALEQDLKQSQDHALQLQEKITGLIHPDVLANEIARVQNELNQVIQEQQSHIEARDAEIALLKQQVATLQVVPETAEVTTQTDLVQSEISTQTEVSEPAPHTAVEPVQLGQPVEPAHKETQTEVPQAEISTQTDISQEVQPETKHVERDHTPLLVETQVQTDAAAEESKHFEEELQKLQLQLNQQKEQQLVFHQQEASLKETIHRLEQEKEESAQLKNSIETLQQELARLKEVEASSQHHKNEIVTLQQAIEVERQSRNALDQQYQETLQKLTALEQDNQQISELKSQLAVLQLSAQAEEKLSQLNEQVATLQLQKEQEAAQLKQDYQTQIDTLNQTVARLQSEAKALEEIQKELSTKNTEIQELHNQLKARDDEINAQKAEI